VGERQRRQPCSRLADERLVEDAQAAGDDEPDVLRSLNGGVPALALERRGDRVCVLARREVDEVHDPTLLARVTAEIGEMLEHARIGDGRILDELHLFHA
jgi:hypothetical protein